MVIVILGWECIFPVDTNTRSVTAGFGDSTRAR